MNVIIHIDEIFLKGSNQPVFYGHLKNNLEYLLPKIKVKRIESGLWIENIVLEQIKQLALIPGFANFAIALKTSHATEDIKKAIDELVQLSSRPQRMDPLNQSVRDSSTPFHSAQNDKRTFRISAERSFKKFPIPSTEIEKEIGEYVRVKYNWKVSLKNPDLNIHINVGKDSAYIFGNTHNAVGGLPTSSCGKVLVLLSGGLDSPVAAYKMMTRGAQAHLVHFQNQTSVTEEVSAKIFDLAKVLARYQPEIKLFIVPFAAIQKEVIMKIPAEYRMIVTRRIFNKIAEKIAQEYKYLALVSGNSLGQVASQTLENMSVISKSSEMLQLSPLIGTNKKDIIEAARTIGTFDISIRPYEDCCSLFVAKHPQIKAKLENVLRFEANMDSSLIDSAKADLFTIIAK
ncbi:MAG: tRNA 4-thiouridine(8) synthase ThiI [Candidatus Magasanikbacteria bacterium]|nr:tRNA 4-thiouridine(8) synthase ThiI [Candidatus Magasanikbacteria bacterium]